MKLKKLGLYILLVISLVLAACQETGAETAEVGEYVFRVEEAVGDRYNVRFRYSLTRADGGVIHPDTRFQTMEHQDDRSSGSMIYYRLSDDGKTLWIEQSRSSSSKYKHNERHTIILKNLEFGEDSGLEPIPGEWSVTFRLQINEDYIELLDHDLNIQSQEDENYYIRLSSIQLSEMGIHMMMELPENDIHRFLDRFHSALVLKDGTVIDLELHHSIRGKKAPFRASGEELFDETIALNEIHAVVICGQEVLVNSR